MKAVRAWLVAIFAAAIVAGMLPPARAEVAAEPAAAPRLHSTFLVGDSTSWRLTGKYDGRVNLFRQNQLDWHIDAIGGRSLLVLPKRILWYLSHVDSAPDTFVMALGTNPYPGWQKWHYELCLALLPRNTKVVLVTPAVFGTRWAKSHNTKIYARWLAEIAAERPHTALADWRRQVKRSHPNPRTGRSPLLAEGIHQTPVTGRRAWLKTVMTQVNQVS